MSPAEATTTRGDDRTMAPEPTPVASVIMIFLNARRYMAEAIESVVSQTLPSWELVLVDDGSSDGSRDIALDYATRDPDRIRLFEHPERRNLGTGPSRNAGMRMARGRYLAFLDADDVYEPERLARTVSLLEADPDLGVVLNSELYWRSWQGAGSAAGRLTTLPDEIVSPSAVPGEVFPPPLLMAGTLATPGAVMPAICSITFRRQSVIDLGGIPESFDSQYEDQALIVKLLMNCSCVVVEDCLVRYRQHAESLTHRAMAAGEYLPGRPHPQREKFIRWLMGYTASLGFDEPRLTAALTAELEARTRGAALVLDALRRRMRRAALIAVKALLPRRAGERLIGSYVTRQRSRARASVARNMKAMRFGHRGSQ